MKNKVLLLALAILGASSLKAQLNVGSTSAADASAILQATSTTKGFLPPVMTTTQINAIVSPANGLTVYNSTLSQLQVNVGTPAVPSWSVAAGGANVYWSKLGNTGTTSSTNYIGTTDTAALSFRTKGTEQVRIDSSGNVGIGTTTPYAPLQFANTVANRKIVLLDQGLNSGNDSNFYGFGINSSTIRYQVPAGGMHSFYTNKTLMASIDLTNLIKLSGSLTANSDIAVGRTAVEGTMAIAGTAGSYYTGAIPGDMVVRAEIGSLITGTMSSNPLLLMTNAAEKMRITSAGLVGIGTTTPAATLDVVGNMRVATTATAPNTDDLLTINGSGIVSRRTVASLAVQTPDVSIYSADGTITSNRTLQLGGRYLTISGTPNDPSGSFNLLSGTAGIWSMMGFGRTATEGRIGIGAGSGQYLSSAVPGDMMIWTAANNIQIGSNGAGAVVLSTTGAERFRITPNGLIGINNNNPSYNLDISGNVRSTGNMNAPAFTVTSDRRLKKNILPLNSALGKVMQLMAYSYEKKDSLRATKYELKEMGFIAQDVQKVFPNLVTAGKDADKLLAINYIALIPLLTKAIQEQQAQVLAQVAITKSQATEIASLKKENISIAAQLADMKDIKIAMAAMQTELGKLAIIKVAASNIASK